MSNVTFFHNALGKTDGVSLEVDKWRAVLQKMGHKVFYCAGNDDVANVLCIPELSFMYPQTWKLIQNATVKLSDYDEATLKREIFAQANVIKQKLWDFITTHQIDILIPNNLLSVGYHLPAMIAFHEIIRDSRLPTIVHNHDFYFENSGEVSPTCPTAWEILDTYSAPDYPHTQNIVINRLGQSEVKKRKKLETEVVPNVFDFDQPAWEKDEYNRDLRASFGIGENDLVFLQATRVMDRKGIELAIDVIAELNQPAQRVQLESHPLYDGRQLGKEDKIFLLCAGRIEKFGISEKYHSGLIRRAEKQNVNILFVGDYIKHSRGSKHGRKIYSLWDTYAHADFVTYPSIWEGWGNQLIEAVFARLPVVLFEYPVYQTDLKPAGLEVVSLGRELADKDAEGLAILPPEKITQAAREIVAILTDARRYRAMTHHNFEISRNSFSYQALETIIRRLLGRIEKYRPTPKGSVRQGA